MPNVESSATQSPSYQDISYWAEQPPLTASSSALDHDRDYDVAIVGGGFTGLWSAYYLKQQRPELSVCVLEAHVCGFGASGRNGGWLMSALEGEAKLIDALEGESRDAALGFIHGIGGEVAAVLKRHGIDCDYHHGGGIYAAARYPEQEKIQRDHLKHLMSTGHNSDDYRWMDARELSERLHIHNPIGGIYTPHVARIHPRKLVQGLLEVVLLMPKAGCLKTHYQIWINY
jgi:glycine/D-amino acid oxidase-like deaminating enzyme